MSDTLIIAFLTALTGAIGGVWRDNVRRLKEQTKEIQKLQAENIKLHKENADLQALYAALYFELYGEEPDETEASPERPATRRDRRRRAVDRRRAKSSAKKEEPADEEPYTPNPTDWQ